MKIVLEEGHYTIKRVKRLPKRGNYNWLYCIKNEDTDTDIIDKLYRYLPNGTYQEIFLGSGGSTSVLTDNNDGTYTHNDGNGNIVIIDTDQGGLQDLQSVLDTGNHAKSLNGNNSVDIDLDDNTPLFESIFYNGKGNEAEIRKTLDIINLRFLKNDSGGRLILKNDIVVLGRIFKDVNNNKYYTNLSFETPIGNNTYLTPTKIGTNTEYLATSVNGNYADSTGNINLPTGNNLEHYSETGLQSNGEAKVLIGDYSNNGNNTLLDIDDVNNYIDGFSQYIGFYGSTDIGLSGGTGVQTRSSTSLSDSELLFKRQEGKNYKFFAQQAPSNFLPDGIAEFDFSDIQVGEMKFTWHNRSGKVSLEKAIINEVNNRSLLDSDYYNTIVFNNKNPLTFNIPVITPGLDDVYVELINEGGGDVTVTVSSGVTILTELPNFIIPQGGRRNLRRISPNKWILY